MKIFSILFCILILTTANVQAGDDYPIKPIEMTNVVVRSGFWMPRIETNRLVTVPIAFKRCEETGRIHNFEAAARRDVTGFRGIPYDDSAR